MAESAEQISIGEINKGNTEQQPELHRSVGTSQAESEDKLVPYIFSAAAEIKLKK